VTRTNGGRSTFIIAKALTFTTPAWQCLRQLPRASLRLPALYHLPERVRNHHNGATRAEKTAGLKAELPPPEQVTLGTIAARPLSHRGILLTAAGVNKRMSKSSKIALPGERLTILLILVLAFRACMICVSPRCRAEKEEVEPPPFLRRVQYASYL